MKRYLVTSALPYANGYLHLGHCAGAYLPADIYVRYLRLKSKEVLYVCGSDEHGVAITIAAEKEKVTPQEIIDKYHYANKEAFEKFGMSFDIYSRTSLPIHHETAREFFKVFLQKGFLLEREEEQYYDENAKMFLPDRYVEGICPNCGFDHARGDQCDSCGAYYDQLELKNPVSLVSGKPPVVKKTNHWYMKFDVFQKFLENYIEGHNDDWKDNVLQQSRSWLKQGLTERAITRDLSWGVKINDIPGISAEKAEGKVLYVWFDAVLGYISGTKELMLKLAEDNKAKPDDWKKWWQSDETNYIAFIGKDNIVFHTLIFPAMLNGRGNNYILPQNVPANEFLNLEGQKFSKSRNWSIDLRDFIIDFPEERYIDSLRYTLAVNLPETKDSDFTWKDFQARSNNELTAVFGNFVNRTLQFIFKNFDGQIPSLSDTYKSVNLYWNNLVSFFESNDIGNGEKLNNVSEDIKRALSENDINLIYSLWKGIYAVSDCYERFRFRDGLMETMNIARAANKYFNDEEPWKTLKSDPAKCAKTLFICTQLVNSLAVLFAPVVPFTSKKIFGFLNIEPQTGEPLYGKSEKDYWNGCKLPLLVEGYKLNQPELLFSRIEDDIIEKQVSKLGAKTETQASPEQAELITIDDFAKIKMRTGKIIHAENVPKSKKLLKLKVDIGQEQRQVLAGIAEHYKPDDLIGKIVIIVTNLKPAKLMGLESQGMMLAASDSDGKLYFLTPEKDDISPGAEVR